MERRVHTEPRRQVGCAAVFGRDVVKESRAVQRFLEQMEASGLAVGSPGMFTTASTHGLNVGDEVYLWGTPMPVTPGGPLQAGTIYWVQSAPSSTTFTISATSGGVALALAAQKTIENLFGGVAVITDRPVSIGDSRGSRRFTRLLPDCSLNPLSCKTTTLPPAPQGIRSVTNGTPSSPLPIFPCRPPNAGLWNLPTSR